MQRPISTDDTLQRRPTSHSQVTNVLGRVTIERKGEKEKYIYRKGILCWSTEMTMDPHNITNTNFLGQNHSMEFKFFGSHNIYWAYCSFVWRSITSFCMEVSFCQPPSAWKCLSVKTLKKACCYLLSLTNFYGHKMFLLQRNCNTWHCLIHLHFDISTLLLFTY